MAHDDTSPSFAHPLSVRRRLWFYVRAAHAGTLGHTGRGWQWHDPNLEWGGVFRDPELSGWGTIAAV